MMKLPLLALYLLATALATAPVFAQPESTAEKPQGASVAFNAPAKQVDQFFRVLTEGRVDAAYDELLKGTSIAQMSKDVASELKAKTRGAIRAYGDISGYDLVDMKEVGSHLTRVTCLALAKQIPIRWRFYFYKTSDTWKLVDIGINDRLVDLFEEPIAVPTSPAK